LHWDLGGRPDSTTFVGKGREKKEKIFNQTTGVINTQRGGGGKEEAER